MKFKSKMVRFLLSTVVIASMLCACTNDVINPEVDKVSVQRMVRPNRPSQINPEYGMLHNDILYACLAECQYQINPNDYIVYSINDTNFYSLYAAYTNLIKEKIFEIMDEEYGEIALPIGTIGTPQDYWLHSNYLRSQIEMNCPGVTFALDLVEELFEEHLELTPEDAVLEEDPYWIDLAENIEGYAEDIYTESEALCQTEEEIEVLGVMLSVMVSSFNYWSDAGNMAAWRDLEWNAKCKYLNLSELTEIELEGEHADNEKSTKEKVCEFVREDINGAASGAALGALFAGVGAVNGAIAIGSICSGLTALSWD